MFYPSDAAKLSEMVQGFLGEAVTDGSEVRAIIAPHAGYNYSGRTAGVAFSYLQKAKHEFSRILLIGPAHRLPLSGIALSTATHFETPLGLVEVDTKACAELEQLPGARWFDEAHTLEHCLEVELPFIQETFENPQIIPFLVGEMPEPQLDAAFDKVCCEQTAIVVSSDLSHFHDYNYASRIDGETSADIESLSEKKVTPERACGAYAVRGLLRFARSRGLQAQTVDLCNSGDVTGEHDSVVGYGAYVLRTTASAQKEV